MESAMLDPRTLPADASAMRTDGNAVATRPSRGEAEAAVRTLIRWAGDRPAREGLEDIPARVVRACEEWFGG